MFAFNIDTEKMLKINPEINKEKMNSILNGGDCLLFVQKTRILEVLYNNTST
jgi:hypothetical protein